MQYLTLDEIKKQCVIDADYHDDDEFLTMIGDAAEDLTSQMLDYDLQELFAEYGEMPATIKHAMRMLVDYFYAVNRGSADHGKEIHDAVFVMLKLYRRFN